MTGRALLLVTTTALCAALAATAANGQPAPFDMAPESRSTAPAPARPAAPASPAEREPAAAAAPVPAGGDAVPATAPGSAPAAQATASPPPADDGRRYLLPMERLTLSGETAVRRWSVFLSDSEAGAARTLRVTYQSSILVAPETSRLRVVLNGQVLLDAPVQAPNAPVPLVIEIPAGLTQPGLNALTFETTLRHRTDCSVQSTYDLWAEIDAAQTYMTFGPDAVRGPDLRAAGVDAIGRTGFSVVVPVGAMNEATAPSIRLSQALVLLAGVPNPAVAVSDALPETAGPGNVTVLLGPVADLTEMVGELPAAAARDPFANFATLADGRRVFLVSGPSWNAVGQAVESVVAPTDRPTSLTRSAIAEPGWRTPDAPLLFSGAALGFRSLGVPSQEFDGRLFRTNIAVALPADFYAEAYGEANLLLDAAYSAEVLPSSRIDVYVNGEIATTIPIGSRGGGVLRAYPVPVTLRHFRPGVNTLTIEAVLDTAADAACLPGTASGAGTRFVLFDSSQFQMPDFARISRRPDLAALSGVGFPYNRVDGPIPLVLGETTAPTVSAAASFAGRLALVAGRPMDFQLSTPAAASGLDAVFVGTAARLASGVLAQTGVSDVARASWGAGGGGGAPVLTASDQTISIDQWEDAVGNPWEQPFIALETWLADRFDLTGDALRLTVGTDEPYAPPSEVPFLVAQGPAPDGAHSWTVVTAPDGAALVDGVARATREDDWSHITGRLTAYDSQQALYIALPANDAILVQTVPFSLANTRLVVANWLSSHALAYALVLAIASIALGIATGALTGRLGRER